ncbi:MAG: hypothetical protein AAGI25_21075 [Bacteroidota bacterium]
MKVTTELLERHGMGLCTEEEKKAIKLWFETLDDPSMNLPVTPEVNEDRIWSKMSQSVPELQGYGGAPTLPLHLRVVRYAAAACIIFAAFFGGRFSASTANANETIDKSSKDMLYVFGGNGAEGYLSGDQFKVGFDGVLRLYNNSFSQKTIHLGNTSFVLDSYQTYFLSGSAEKPRLISRKFKSADQSWKMELKGSFFIHRTDKYF